MKKTDVQKLLVNKINARLAETGWTKREFAARAGLFEQHIGDILHNRSKGSPAYFTIYGIAKACGVTTEQLLELPPLTVESVIDELQPLKHATEDEIIAELTDRVRGLGRPAAGKIVEIYRLLKRLNFDPGAVEGIVRILRAAKK